MTDDMHPTLRQLGDDMARIFSPPEHEGAMWTSLKDRLPPIGRAILLTDGNTIVTAARSAIEGAYTSVGWSGEAWQFDFDTATQATHWMPLPDLPE